MPVPCPGTGVEVWRRHPSGENHACKRLAVKTGLYFSTVVENALASFSTCVEIAGVMPNSPIELTGAEWAVVKAIWEKEPCTAPEVLERLAERTDWTYSTVRTLMDRMVAKGLLSVRKEGKLSWFQSLVNREQAQRGELLYALKHAFDGATAPLVRCLLDSHGLSEKELDELDALIRERRNSKPSTSGK